MCLLVAVATRKLGQLIITGDDASNCIRSTTYIIYPFPYICGYYNCLYSIISTGKLWESCTLFDSNEKKSSAPEKKVIDNCCSK